MAEIDSKIPCICGQISLNGKKLQPTTNPDAELIYTDPSGTAIFYRLGEAKNSRIFKGRKGTTIIVGTIYSPVVLSHTKESEIEMIDETLDLDLKKFEGNYILISIQNQNNGSPLVSIATDRFGTRLALYSQQHDSLFISTHFAGMRFLLDGRLPPIADDSLLHFYHFGFTANDRTLFNGMNKIPPGSRLLISDQKVKLEKYIDLWDLFKPHEYAGLDENEIAEQINLAMFDSVIRRNPQKRPIALTLSGGVDSGFIAKKCRQAGMEVNGYNLAYGKTYDEFARVDKIAKTLNINLRKLIATPEMLLESVEEANRASSEPVKFNDAAMRLLALEAKKDGFDSVWDGDGADRLFFGMNRQMQYFKLLKLYKKLKKFHCVSLLTFFAAKLKNTEWKKLAILLKNWEKGIPAYPERRFGKIKKYNEVLERSIFELGIMKYWQEFIKNHAVEDLILYFTFQSINMCPEMFFHPPAEQQSMLGLSAVSPYWDTDLVSLALSIPSYLKAKKGQTKYILRKAAGMGGNQKYWHAKKIGLQDAYKFCLQSEQGTSWRDKEIQYIYKSQEFQFLSSCIPHQKIDVDSLLVLNLWKRINKIG